MAAWQMEARGVYSRSYRFVGPSEIGRRVVMYRLRPIDQRGVFGWEVWDGPRKVTDGKSLALAKAHAEASGRPGVLDRRSERATAAPAAFASAPPRSPVTPLAVAKTLVVAVVALNAVYQTWAFVAGEGGRGAMLASVAVFCGLLVLNVFGNQNRD
ncbi:MAG: hypothetical protein ACI8PZ_006820 [Myxococcota bacterium]|jgi:hypothetical protein